MNFYHDEDSADGDLVALLRSEGHDVFEPPRSLRPATPDPVHLTRSIRMDRVILTKNHRDFRDLHDLVEAAGGDHPGILAICQDNDGRDMKIHEIVSAITRLMGLGIPIPGALHVLNSYRGR